MELIERFLTKNRCYTNAIGIKVTGLMLHSVGVGQPRAEVFINRWNNPEVAVCVHAFAQADGKVYQTLPWDYKAWHAGGLANSYYSAGVRCGYVGVEMTEPASLHYTGSGSSFTDSDPAATRTFLNEVFHVAVELFAQLCKKYSLDPMRDIISHAEGHRMGIASDHDDPDALWSRYPELGLSMDRFRSAVKTRMEQEEPMTQQDFDRMMQDYNARNNPTYNTVEQVPAYWQAETQQLVDAGAIGGDGVSPLGVTRSELKAAIIAKRYTDAKLEERA